MFPGSRQNVSLCSAEAHDQATFDEVVRMQTEQLQHLGLCTNARVVHLLANTTKKLTLLSMLQACHKFPYMAWHTFVGIHSLHIN